MHSHTAPEAAPDGAVLVVGEVDITVALERIKYAPETRFVARVRLDLRQRPGCNKIRVAGKASEFAGDIFWRQNEIDAT